MTPQHPIVAVLDSLRRDAAVMHDTRYTLEQRESARRRFEANLRSLGVDPSDAQRIIKSVAA